jgi:hypothetical protein
MPKRRSKLKCDICDEGMEIVRIIPAAAHLPELKTYRCAGCECFITLEPAEEAEKRAASELKAEPKTRSRFKRLIGAGRDRSFVS